MWEQVAQGGVGLLGLGLGFKLLWPLLSKFVEASASRSETDSTLHGLYQDTLKAQREISEELSKAREEIGALRIQVNTLTQELTEARKLLAKAEESLAAESNKRSALEVR